MDEDYLITVFAVRALKNGWAKVKRTPGAGVSFSRIKVYAKIVTLF